MRMSVYKISANVMRIGLVRAFKDTSPKLRIKQSDEKLRPKRDIACIRLMRCYAQVLNYQCQKLLGSTPLSLNQSWSKNP